MKFLLNNTAAKACLVNRTLITLFKKIIKSYTYKSLFFSSRIGFPSITAGEAERDAFDLNHNSGSHMPSLLLILNEIKITKHVY